MGDLRHCVVLACLVDMPLSLRSVRLATDCSCDVIQRPVQTLSASWAEMPYLRATWL